MSLRHVAGHLASKGRDEDSVLVHMTPKEVGGLQALAMAHGGSLTVNPTTGLPEAGFLKNILPTLIGAGLAATGVGMPVALAAGAGVGALSNRKNPLMGALMGGLGAYGGAGLAGGLNAAGAAAADAATQAAASGAGAEVGAANAELLSPEIWPGQTPPITPPTAPVTPPAGMQVPSVVAPNPVIPSTGTPIVPPNTASTAGYPVVEPAAPVGEIGQGMEPGMGGRSWSADTLARPAAPSMSPFQKVGAAFERPEEFMKGVGGTSGLIKYGVTAAAPVLLAPPEDGEKKPWWADAKLPQYRYERGYTGGVREPGSAASSEKRYFSPQYVAMADGGGVDDQLALAKQAGRGFGAAFNIARQAPQSFLSGNREAIPGIIQSNMSAALRGTPAPGITALPTSAQPAIPVAAQPVYAPAAQQQQVPMFNAQSARPASTAGLAGLQPGFRAIDTLGPLPARYGSTLPPAPNYTNPYVGGMTGGSATAARYLSGQYASSGPQGPVRQGPSAPIYPIGGGEPITVGALRSPSTAPASVYAGQRLVMGAPVPGQPTGPAGGIYQPDAASTYMIPGAPAPMYVTPAPAAQEAYYPAPVYQAPAPSYEAPAPVYQAPEPDRGVRIPPPVVGRSPEESVASPAPIPVAPPPPLSLDDMIRLDAPAAQQRAAVSAQDWYSKTVQNQGASKATQDYLSANPDLVEAAQKSGQSLDAFAAQHYAQYGRNEKRPGTAGLDLESRRIPEMAGYVYGANGEPQYIGSSGDTAVSDRFSGNAAGGHLKSGGFVVPADVVSALGNGSTDAGLEVLMRKFNAKPIDGPGDGMSDSIATTIEGKHPARVARGEAYIGPKEVQSAGGSAKLYKMLDRIRTNAHGKTSQQRKVNPSKVV